MALRLLRPSFAAALSLTVLLCSNTAAEAAHSGPKWSRKHPHPDPQIEYHLAKIDFQKALNGMRAANVATGIRDMSHALGHMRNHHHHHGGSGYNNFHRQQAIVGGIVGIIQAIAVDNYNNAQSRMYAASARHEAWLKSRLSLEFEERASRGMKPGDLFAVGLQLEFGDRKQRLPSNPAKAIRWYVRAAKRGFPRSQFRLGLMYVRGNAVKQDLKAAVRWFQEAADAGNTDAQFQLGTMFARGEGVKRDQRQALDYLEQASDSGHLDAMVALGRHYQFGLGVAEDKERAFSLFKKAAGKKHPPARLALGRLYELGEGVKRNVKKAVKEYERAAKQDFLPAMDQLGVLYANGEGIRQDERKAFRWFEKAAKLGYPVSQFHLGMCYVHGDGTRPDRRKANSLFRNAARQGLSIARFEIGVSYRDGRGSRKDLVFAWAWFDFAADGRLPQAAEAREAVGKQLTKKQLEEARQQRARLERPLIAANESPSAPDRAVRPNAASPKPTSSGTGFFVTTDGYLITNEHVVRGATRIVVLTGKGTVEAKLINVDKQGDLALLKIEGSSKSLPVISSRGLTEGSKVFTFGHPNPDIQGVDPVYTSGDISKLTGIKDDPRTLQISVPVQPGNSGGPLVDEYGNVVGVVVSRLDAIKLLKKTGSLPQNVNYAMKSTRLLLLLEEHIPDSIKKLKASFPMKPRNAGQVRSEVKQATVLILVERSR